MERLVLAMPGSRRPESGAPAPTFGRVLRAGALYFGVVFGAGLVIGPVRVLWLAPRVGERAAELIEAPIMVCVIALAARWISRRIAPAGPAAHLAVGATALGLLLLAEAAVVLLVWRTSIGQYIGSRDLVGLSVYVALLVLFAAMPVPFALRRQRTTQP